ncbi:DUF882 domain-containing protein [Methylobacterium nodulans]|uniref:Murein endopeptidase K n=1 Tax=Methylobacterium nodulans (strain LMG 21967 / CNCM I-2342 / ORS 2060) TaxID=460265 RepID=B8I9K8_METNO|nr:DUF882 domain-containing protein [Methylobacterium nodulans]ACL55261.1 protein of unknown function DUF882 [Methylobacterium nodulans ORS 2060]
MAAAVARQDAGAETIVRALLRTGCRTAATLREFRSRSADVPRLRPSLRRAGLAAAAVAAALVGGTRGTQDAAANGDTRTLSIIHEHTKESATVTFKRDGRYDRAALEQLNWLLRDWRIDEPTKMDPRLFDVVWEAHRASGSRDAVHIVSAYRSPQTNAALRRRSRAVAEHSQHMLGKAMDFFLTDVSVDQIREIGMRMQRGGVGWYPHAYNPFVHLDVGSVRAWPRMSYDQLARLFPDGRTVHLPRDGRPLPGYEVAKAEILARGGSVLGYGQAVAALDEEDSPSVVGQFFSMLFGGGSKPAPAPAPAPQAPPRVRPVALASAAPDDAGTRGALAYAAQPDPRAALLRDASPPPAAPGPAAAGPAEPPAPSEAAAPLPPRRPAEFAALAEALAAAPLPPARPAAVQIASADPAALGPLLPPRSSRSPVAEAAAGDAKAQLRALFVAAADPAAPQGSAVQLTQARTASRGTPPAGLVAAPAGDVALRFQPRGPEAVDAGRFSGSAVKPGSR